MTELTIMIHYYITVQVSKCMCCLLGSIANCLRECMKMYWHLFAELTITYICVYLLIHLCFTVQASLAAPGQYTGKTQLTALTAEDHKTGLQAWVKKVISHTHTPSLPVPLSALSHTHTYTHTLPPSYLSLFHYKLITLS